MLDHMIFNKLKWFNIADNADSVTANGKKYVSMPKSFTIKKGANLGYLGVNQYESYAYEDTNVTCVGSSNDHYYFIGNVKICDTPGSDYAVPHNFSMNQISSQPGFVSKADTKNVIWGGKNLLHTIASMVEYAFTSFKKGAETC